MSTTRGMSSPTTTTTTTTLLTLPSELVEAILTSSRSPRTVAAIAQTCRTLRTLVYTSPDSHLWRELFLTAWDDPRPALEHRALVDPRIDPAAWDWGTEYRRRVSADRWLKAWRRDISPAPCDDDDPPTTTNTSWQALTTTALAALLDTLLTLTPFPATPPIALKVLTPTATSQISPYPTGNAGSGLGDRRERMTSAPPLPPLLIVLATGVAAFERSRSVTRVGRVVFGPHATRRAAAPAGEGETSSDSGVQAGVLPTPALPPQMVRTLLASYEVGVRGVPAYGPSLTGAGRWAGDALGDVFHRIVCITGFVPIPPPMGDYACGLGGSASAAAARAPEADSDGTEGGDDTEKLARAQAFPLAHQQYTDARVLARRRVYDMQYLRGDRLWGPYQTVTRMSRDGRSGAGSTRRGSQRGTGKGDGLGTVAWAMGAAIEPDEFDLDLTSDDSKDEDWEDTSGYARKQRRSSSHDTLADIDMEMEPEHPLISLILASTVASDNDGPASRQSTRRSNPRLPPNSLVNPGEIRPHHLRPDYVYLASVRMVVEANLRELFGNEPRDDRDQVASALRPGTVGMFWEDEDELLRMEGVSGAPGTPRTLSSSSSSPHAISASNATPGGPGILATTNSNTFELADILAEFKNMEVARLGSACGYWGGWVEGQQTIKQGEEDALGVKKPRIVADRASLEQPVQQGKGKGKGKEKDSASMSGDGLGDWEVGLEGEACEGWDWAGVAGIWRRCVCWMDYRELLFFNLDSSKFLTLDTQEACRIIPMELRITGYTRAGLMPVYDTDARSNINVLLQNGRPSTSVCTGYFRPPPVIHFSGASVGSDRGMDDGRRVRGCVQLIGGGEVRWQMDTYTQECDFESASAPEWSSEAVQVGGLGSAAGVLGMWTGAAHERADPLGPFWAWKVT